MIISKYYYTSKYIRIFLDKFSSVSLLGLNRIHVTVYRGNTITILLNIYINDIHPSFISLQISNIQTIHS